MDAHRTDPALRLVNQLARQRQRLILAESCTGGLVAAELAGCPGVSEWLCGSFVVYREDSKRRWLGVSAETLEHLTAVSEPVARQMALGAWRQTPEADIAAAVTGHLGPNAPDGFDGLLFIATAAMDSSGTLKIDVGEHHVGDVTHDDPRQQRRLRQQAAAALVMEALLERLEDGTAGRLG